MKVLVDECINPRFALALERQLPYGWSCLSVNLAGWSGYSNGDLHKAAVDAGYGALVTRDLAMPFQTPPLLPVVVIPSTGAFPSDAKYTGDVARLVAARQLEVRYHAVEPHENEEMLYRRKQQMEKIKKRQVFKRKP